LCRPSTKRKVKSPKSAINGGSSFLNACLVAFDPAQSEDAIAGEGGVLTPLLKLPSARQTRKFAEKRERAMRESGRSVMLGEAIVNTCLVLLISVRAFRLAVNYTVDGNASRNNGG